MRKQELSSGIAEFIDVAIELHVDWLEARQANWRVDDYHGRMDKKFRIALKQLQETADNYGLKPPRFDLNLPKKEGSIL